MNNLRDKKLKNELEEELLKLVEIVLLDKYHDDLTPKEKKAMEKRLANLTNSGVKDVGLSLNMID